MKKRPDFIVFSDIDGTTAINSGLKHIYRFIIHKGGTYIPVTGRSTEDARYYYENEAGFVPEIIIGNNGAATLFTLSNSIITRTIEQDRIKQIIDYFLSIEGNPEYVRYSDGRKTMVSDAPQASEYYYKRRNTTDFINDLAKKIQYAPNLVGMYLSSGREIATKMKDFASQLGLWTDIVEMQKGIMGNGTINIDIVPSGVNKGTAVENTKNTLKPKTYMCVGDNGNDESMLKLAINDGQVAVLMDTAPLELIKEMEIYATQKSGKLIILPTTKELSNPFVREMVGEISKRMLPGKQMKYINSTLGRPLARKAKMGYGLEELVR